MPSYVVTGAGRGLGVAFIEQLAADPANTVIATARKPEGSTELARVQAASKAKFHVVKWDVGALDQLPRVVDEVAKIVPGGLDYLILNAGVNAAPMDSTLLETLEFKDLTTELHVNVVAPTAALRAFTPLLAKAKGTVTALSSVLGSVAYLGNVGVAPSYSISKAGLNMSFRKFSGEVKDKGITVVLIHPGWIKTEIGLGIDKFMISAGLGDSNITPETSVSGILKVTHAATLEESGAALKDHAGEVIPW